MQSYMMPSTDDGLDTDEYGRPKKRRDPSVANATGRAVSTAPAPAPADLQPVLPNNPQPTPIRPTPDPTMTQKAMMPTTGVNDGVYDLGRIKDKGGLTAQQRVEAIRQDKAKMAQSMIPSGAAVPQSQPSAAQQMATMFPTAARIAGEGAGAFTIGENERLRTSVGGQYAMQDAGDIYGRMDALQSGNVAPGQARDMGLTPSVNWNAYAGAGDPALQQSLGLRGSGGAIRSQADSLYPSAGRTMVSAKESGLGSDITQKDVLKHMAQTRGNEDFATAQANLLAQRQGTAMNAKRLQQASAGGAGYESVLNDLMTSPDPNIRLQAAKSMQAMKKPDAMNDDEWTKIQIDGLKGIVSSPIAGEHGAWAAGRLRELIESRNRKPDTTGASGNASTPATPPADAKEKAMRDGKQIGWRLSSGALVDLNGKPIQ